ncbi:MAG: hypothetical protein ACFFG0_17600 [Candidatus Thorarchaeota archaeon]
MKIYKTLVSFTDAHLGKMMKCDTIKLNDKFWLVPEWIDNLSEGTRQPLRIICLDYLPHQKIDSGSPADFLLKVPIPICVFKGEVPAETKFRFEIVENPDVIIDIPKKQDFH